MSTSLERSAQTQSVEVTFPGGLAVQADYRGHSIRTDQPERHGGTNSGPAPFDLFLASIATCAGFYAAQFARSRDLPTEGLKVSLEPVKSDDGKRIAMLRLLIVLPTGFPEKYRPALERAIDQCAVKRHIIDPPQFAIELRD